MKQHLWQGFITEVKKQVVPALGCTEPVAVALSAAIAREHLQQAPQQIHISVSANLMKNGMGVTVPGTGMVGLPIAAAVGALCGEPTAGLEVLKNIEPTALKKAKAMLNQDRVKIKVAPVENCLYSKTTLSNGANNVTVIIADSHTQVVHIDRNGIPLFTMENPTGYVSHCANKQFSHHQNNPFSQACARDIFDFALNVPLTQIRFIQQASQLNDALSAEGLTNSYGLQVGATYLRNVKKGLLSQDLLTDILIRTSAAADARMGGAMLPAMSNCGSGNQGIAATMPVLVLAQHLNIANDKMLRALMLSHLMAIYIKSYQLKLSALCAVSTASMGAAAAMTWLLGGSYQQVSHAICSMVGDISGIFCDGAKNACAMKVSSAANAAVKAAILAQENIRVTGNEGIVAENVDDSIRNLSALTNNAMLHSDRQILQIIVDKT